MNKIYNNTSESFDFIKKYLKNYKSFKEEEIIFFLRILLKIIPDIKDIPKDAFIDISKFNEEITSLPLTYQKVLNLRYGRDDNVCHTFKFVGEKIYISASRCSKINHTTIRILKKNIDNYYFLSKTNKTVKAKTSLSDLKLSPRAHNVLIRSKIYSIEDLMKLTKDDLMTIFGIGDRIYKEIIEKLNNFKKLS